MADASRNLMLDRRDFVLGSAATVLAGSMSPAEGAESSAQFESAIAGLLDGATPKDGGIDMDLPDSVENGDYVPVALSVASPMTPQSHVKSLHLLSTLNPRAHVATFRFTALSGKARVTSRMRLAKSQEVVALAELSDGAFLMARRFVDVKIGGCGI